MHQLLTIASVIIGLTGGMGAELKPWSTNKDPSDVAKSHVQEITAAQQQYSVTQGGTMDGQNCRSPLGCAMAGEGAVEQTWESNRAVRMQNVGATNVINPWLSNGRNNYRTMDEIVARAVTPDMTDKEKAIALWFQEVRLRFHQGGPDGMELGNPVKVINTYGFNTCGNDSICLAGLWHKAGIKKVAPVLTMGHCISQAFFDDRWNLLDGDQQVIYLLRDNETIASEQDIVRDHDLVKRTHVEGILLPEDRGANEWEASAYVYEGGINGDRSSSANTTMAMVLRPNEAIVWRWGHLDPYKRLGTGRNRYPDCVYNGLWEYRPDFSGKNWTDGADKAEGVKSGAEGLTAESGKSGEIIWTIRSPYVFVGGHLDVEGSGAKFAVSLDDKKVGDEKKVWTEVGDNFDKVFAVDKTNQPAYYKYQLRCQLGNGAHLKQLGIVNDLEMSIGALPGMVVGKNDFAYTDESTGDRKVRITHDWVERSAAKPPEAPPAPIYPPDAGKSDGTDVVFKWQAPSDPDGNAIADYQFELSNRPDMRWPLSTNFYRMISKTLDKGKAQYSLVSAGLLTSDRQYYWHVRAKNQKGVWGPWGKTWSFTAQGPAYPLDVAVNYDSKTGVGTLSWKPNPVGRQPAKYRVYGSDEKGFSTSDVPYKVNIGSCKELPSQFPANFVAETDATELPLIGGKADLSKPVTTYYRVVAVDQQGKRSGPSDYTTAPRPIIFSKPALAAKVGAEYKYQVQSNRCLGDLRVDGKGGTNFWNIEKPKFAIERGPKWLKIDPATGVLSGTPDAAGKADVVVTATIDHEVKKYDESALRWGVEKIASTKTETVGTATQPFVIEVSR
jgi:hypothetical protein